MSATVAEAPTAPSRRAKKAQTDRTKAERKLAWWLCAPAVFVMLAVTAYPIIYAVYLSLLRADLRFPDDNAWVGLNNYITVLTSSVWWRDFWHTIIIMSVWKVLGYNMVLLLVGLKNIPASLYEAAAIDGAFGWRLFRRITLPLLRPILLFVIVVSTINAYNVFTQVYVMTQGSQAAPGAQLRVLVTDIYQNGFQFFKMGYASAEAVVLTLIILALTLVQFKVIRVDEGA